MAVNLQALIRDADRTLTQLDEKTIKQLRSLLQKSYEETETKIRKRWGKALEDVKNQDRSFAEARARVLFEQLGAILDVIDSPRAFDLLETHVKSVMAAETTAASAIVVAFSPKDALSYRIPIEKIANVTQNIVARLTNHSEAFALKAQESIVTGLVNGHGFRKMAYNLRRETNIVYSRAEMVVRTETMNASDEVRKGRYKASNIQYVQRIATQDSRVCGFCAARAGNVYKIDEAPQVLHPNDRCYNAPWKKEWMDLGLIDDKWMQQHVDDARKRSDDKLRYGVAPFEKYAGKTEPPTPIWTPKSGYTD